MLHLWRSHFRVGAEWAMSYMAPVLCPVKQYEPQGLLFYWILHTAPLEINPFVPAFKCLHFTSLINMRPGFWLHYPRLHLD